MSGERGFDTVYLLLLMILPLSALIARRVPLKRSLLMALAWLAIFLLVMIGIGLARETGLGAGWMRVTRLLGDDEQRVTGGIVRLRMAADGHFWATATLKSWHVEGNTLVLEPAA